VRCRTAPPSRAVAPLGRFAPLARTAALFEGGLFQAGARLQRAERSEVDLPPLPGGSPLTAAAIPALALLNQVLQFGWNGQFVGHIQFLGKVFV
jgi:hypothetical protein